jgi:hypothetical protein
MITKRDRPALRRIKLHEALAKIPLAGQLTITINEGAWDALIRANYESGGIVLEMKNDRPVRAFQKDMSSMPN